MTGTFTQAWSLAEYLRNFYQDFLGVYPLFDTYGFRFNPSAVLEYYGTIQFILGTGLGPIQGEYNFDKKKLVLSGVDLTGELPVVVGNSEYVLSPDTGLNIPLPELHLEPTAAGKLADPEVSVNTQSLMQKDLLEKMLRSEWSNK